MEGQWGLQTLELPQSHVCRLPAFARFTACMLADLRRFAAAYNEAVDEYRQIYHIRTQGTPFRIWPRRTAGWKYALLDLDGGRSAAADCSSDAIAES